MTIKFKKSPVSLSLRESKKQVVDGYKFTIEGIDFNVHKSLNGKGWTVTEYRTGMVIVHGHTKKYAVILLEGKLKHYGSERFNIYIEKALLKQA